MYSERLLAAWRCHCNSLLRAGWYLGFVHRPGLGTRLVCLYHLPSDDKEEMLSASSSSSPSPGKVLGLLQRSGAVGEFPIARPSLSGSKTPWVSWRCHKHLLLVKERTLRRCWGDGCLPEKDILALELPP